MKKIIWILIACIIIGLSAARIIKLNDESSRVVFNPNRVETTPVHTIVANEKMDALHEPLFVKNNRAFVSGARRAKFGVGQRIGDGHIISISNQLDLDTGMYKIITKNVADGENFALQKYTGFFIPLGAIKNNRVMVMENGIATSRDVKIMGRDATNALITNGLNDGDIVILSDVAENTRVEK
ncbi:MAG: hypothetical protein LBL75_01125 [Rickettsiales bacterium]|jgi:hypothetical protein|nr:hypothetical protein [Rickettsiales bacterium]